LSIFSCEKKNYNNEQNSEKGIRIISLAPSITSELVDLGLKNNIVGATSYCDISANNKDLIIGSAISINIEKILLLKPDIVFASGLTKDKTIQTLKNYGLKIYKFGKITSFNHICTNFIELSKYVDKEDIAKKIIHNSKSKMDSLKAAVPKRKDSLNIFFQVGSKPIFTVIPNTFMNDYITFARCRNIVNDLTNPSINRETVINRNPDIIFIISMGILGEKEKEIWGSYAGLNAAKKNKIFIVDAAKAASPTVRSFTESFEVIMNDIYN
jgi:iron complex transport system substrate-binding protein